VPQAVPIDPAKLIEAGRGFAEHTGGKGRPRPIWLRQAVSSAYYALFHCLCRGTADHLLPNGSPQDRLRLTRTFWHKDMNRLCSQIAGRGQATKHVEDLVQGLEASTIAGVAAAFCDLQQARHDADYNHLTPFSKAVALAHLEDAEQAIRTLEQAPERERQAFFALLALGARTT
jgi:hypothetical protein